MLELKWEKSCNDEPEQLIEESKTLDSQLSPVPLFSDPTNEILLE